MIQIELNIYTLPGIFELMIWLKPFLISIWNSIDNFIWNSWMSKKSIVFVISPYREFVVTNFEGSLSGILFILFNNPCMHLWQRRGSFWSWIRLLWCSSIRIRPYDFGTWLPFEADRRSRIQIGQGLHPSSKVDPYLLWFSFFIIIMKRLMTQMNESCVITYILFIELWSFIY